MPIALAVAIAVFWVVCTAVNAYAACDYWRQGRTGEAIFYTVITVWSLAVIALVIIGVF